VELKEKITQLILKVIGELNEQLPPEQNLEKSIETIIVGKEGKLDSVDLIHFIVAVEQMIEDEFEVPITLADERAMSEKHSPFRTVGSLVDYIEMILKENLND